MKRLLPLFLLLSACGRPQSCEQLTHTSANVQSQATQDLRLIFEYWSYKDNRAVEIPVNLVAGKASNVHVANGTRTEGPRYRGKVDFFPNPPSCSATAEESTTALYLSKASFDLAKACRQDSSDGVLVIDKTAACPEGTSEQAKAGVPGTNP